MKPRVLSPYKILTIAAFSTGTAGGLACTTTPHAAPVASNVTLAAPAPPSPPPRTDTGPATVAAAQPEAAPPAADSQEPRLLTLRAELDGEGDKALKRVAHFRPICDAKGYPLVGNLMRKGQVGMQPSTFCTNVRRTAAR